MVQLSETVVVFSSGQKKHPGPRAAPFFFETLRARERCVSRVWACLRVPKGQNTRRVTGQCARFSSSVVHFAEPTNNPKLKFQ